ncbi:hypothetical protein NECID01_0773 [Nematocida sp. AWRm77]|nr:hypothetical protein NECID01_0773 [Nematocida sp. AWRm77]
MKRSTDIDEYFKTEPTPMEGVEGRRSSVRRVSFAPEPPTVYTNTKEDQSKSESSSINMSMDVCNRTSAEMTLEEAGNESLQERESLPICEEVREENFIMEDSDESGEEKKMSICPSEYKTMEHVVSTANPPPPSVIEECPPKEEEFQAHEYTLAETDEKDDIVSDMLSEIVCAGEGNTLVYDTVNVEEVLNKYEAAKQEDAKKIRDLLSETGIRFLDNLSLTNRRETLSKMRNKVTRESLVYYKEYLQKRIELQNAFASGLLSEIEQIRQETGHLEKEIECRELSCLDKSTLSSKLRQIKSDARKEGKSLWHAKRCGEEEKFLQAVQSTQSELEKTLARLKRDLLLRIEQASQINIAQLEQEERGIREAAQTVSTMPEEEIVQFVNEVEENQKVLKALQEEASALAQQRKQAEEAEEQTERDLSAEEERMHALQQSLCAAEVQREDLDRIKESVQRMETVLGVKVLEMTHSRMQFSLCSIAVMLIYDGTQVVDVHAETVQKSPFKEFLSLCINKVPGALDSLPQSIPAIIRYILEMAAAEKETELVGVSVPYEIRYTSTSLDIQFMVRKGKESRMGCVSAQFSPGLAVPSITSNIKGLSLEQTRYGSIAHSIEQAKALAHVK